MAGERNDGEDRQMTMARDLKPGDTVTLFGTQMLFHVDPASAELLTFGEGSTLTVASVSADDDGPGSCLVLFNAGGTEVSLTCDWTTPFSIGATS